jgi:hypothetical protein
LWSLWGKGEVMQSFDGVTSGKEITWETLSIDGRKILKYFLESATGWIWLGMGRSGGPLSNTVRNLRVPKSTGNFLTN